MNSNLFENNVTVELAMYGKDKNEQPISARDTQKKLRATKTRRSKRVCVCVAGPLIAASCFLAVTGLLLFYIQQIMHKSMSTDR